MSHQSTRSAARATRALALAALVVALLVTPAAAAAEAPLTTVDTFDRSFAFDFPQGFQVLERYYGHLDDPALRRRPAADARPRDVGVHERGGTSGRRTRPTRTLAIDAGRIVFDWNSGDVIFEQGPSDGRPNVCVYWGD